MRIISRPDYLLEICLNTTHLVTMEWSTSRRRERSGVTGVPNNGSLDTEHFEERAIKEAPHPPYVWLRYVDATFTVLQESEVEQFTQHRNSMDDNIKFTVQAEQNNRLAFRDTRICLKDDG